ncbi:universal stress protein [Tamlana nanhaiensis]|uniref:Universal stress protein n=1 Tax=Neotamlana nanhaiensis TaxID=1382798 RepID=A0A0D7W688_9FLAO|nr:universal stress protein [Tamlana nanhaiensis]KJD33307.1 universal stress protein [Tamlana nanhaiensis]
MKTKHILIPTDFSENAWNAIVYAINLYGKEACNFFILHVSAENEYEVYNNVPLTQQSSATKVASKPSQLLLQNTIKRIQENFGKNLLHRFVTISDSDSLIKAIRQQVLLNKIDVIVMGTKGVSGCTERTVGTNAGNVITKVNCTTLVVPENAKFVTPKKIAFPTDFSIFYNVNTLQPLADIIKKNHAEIEFLHISKRDLVLNENQRINIEYLEDYFSENSHSFHFLTHTKIEHAIQDFVNDKGVTLITMLGKNLNYFQHILFHPLAKEISYYKDVPFLVLH